MERVYCYFVATLHFEIKICFQKAKSVQRRTVYDFNNANFDSAREHLKNVPLDSAISDIKFRYR